MTNISHVQRAPGLYYDITVEPFVQIRNWKRKKKKKERKKRQGKFQSNKSIETLESIRKIKAIDLSSRMFMWNEINKIHSPCSIIANGVDRERKLQRSLCKKLLLIVPEIVLRTMSWRFSEISFEKKACGMEIANSRNLRQSRRRSSRKVSSKIVLPLEISRDRYVDQHVNVQRFNLKRRNDSDFFFLLLFFLFFLSLFFFFFFYKSFRRSPSSCVTRIAGARKNWRTEDSRTRL